MQDSTDTSEAADRPARRSGGIRGFFKPFFDGTIYDTLRYREGNEDRLGALTKEYNGFTELLQRETKTKRINAYEEILKSDDAWAALDEKMNAYFDDMVEMFPYERRKTRVDASGRKITDTEIVNPENYFKIRIALIQRRFPGGTDGKIGDQDVRDLTACLRVLYSRDLTRLIWKRRLSAIVVLATSLAALLVTVLCMSGAMTSPKLAIGGLEIAFGMLALIGLTGVVGIGGIIAHRMYLRDHKVKYESALKTSASNLRNALHARLTESVSLIAQIMSQIDREKMELKSQDRLKDWPAVVTRWTKLAFWLSARVEALEDYIQVQMWLTRRSHFGLRHMAGIGTVVIFIGFVAALLATLGMGGFSFAALVSGGKLSGVIALGGLGLFVLACGAVTMLNAQDYEIPVISLQDILQMHLIMGHKDTKLHDEIANLIKREKLSILHDEEMFKGPKPR